MTRFKNRSLIAAAATTLAVAAAIAVPASSAAAGSSASSPASSSAASTPGVHTYRVTITNVAKGQPLSPPLIVTNYGSGQFFRNGRTANWGVQQIAENGNNTFLYDSAVQDQKDGYVTDVQRAAAPLVPKGSPADAMFDQTVVLTIKAKSTDRISFISMLGCTNDGFAGIDAGRLPRAKDRTIRIPVYDYDSATEENTEDFADLTAGCQGAIGVRSTLGATGTNLTDWTLAEGGTIHRHEGVFGSSDDGLLPEVHGWDPRKVATFSVTRID